MAVDPPHSLTELFLGFASIGARSFGGVLPWAHRVMVEERKWLTSADFAETVALCQVLPGPNIGNAAIVLGRRWFGFPGAVVAFLGLFGFPFFWVLGLATLYAEAASFPMVKAIVTGVGVAGAGFFIATAVKMGRPIAHKPAALLIIAGCFLAVAIARVSLVVVLPVAAILGLLAARRGLL